MSETQTVRRTITFSQILPAALDATDTSDLAALLALSNPWFQGDSSFWLAMADGLKQYMKSHEGVLVDPDTKNPTAR